MSRKNNIKLEKQANLIIENHFKSFSDVLGIKELRDSQGKYDLTPTEQMENSINKYFGVDYMLITKGDKFKITNGIKFNIVNIDTKGFTYDSKYYGGVYDNGIPQYLLMQVEKQFSNGRKYYGWSNNPNHKTEYIVILINNVIIWLDYSKLIKFMISIYDPFEVLTDDLKIINKIIKKQYDSIIFNKKSGEVNKCLKIPTIELFENGIMTGFYPVETELLNVV